MTEELPSDYEDVVKLANWATKKNILKINLNKLVENMRNRGGSQFIIGIN